MYFFKLLRKWSRLQTKYLDVIWDLPQSCFTKNPIVDTYHFRLPHPNPSLSYTYRYIQTVDDFLDVRRVVLRGRLSNECLLINSPLPVRD